MAVPNTALFQIIYTDGEEEFDVEVHCIRRFQNYAVGEEVEARSEDDPVFFRGKIVRQLPDSRYDVEISEGGEILESVLPQHIRRFDPPISTSIRVGDRVMAQYHGRGKHFPGTVREVYGDRTLYIEYDDGDVDEWLDIKHVKVA
jgi:Domain of unknown function (DUF4537)